MFLFFLLIPWNGPISQLDSPSFLKLNPEMGFTSFVELGCPAQLDPTRPNSPGSRDEPW